MLPIAGGGKFISIGDKIRFPDDVTMGFIIGEFVRSKPKWPWTYIYIILYTEHLLKVPLTVVDNFHSHLEPMEFIRQDTFQDQVSFSYAHMKNQWNVIKVDGFDMKTDPKRFYSCTASFSPTSASARPDELVDPDPRSLGILFGCCRRTSALGRLWTAGAGVKIKSRHCDLTLSLWYTSNERFFVYMYVAIRWTDVLPNGISNTVAVGLAIPTLPSASL